MTRLERALFSEAKKLGLSQVRLTHKAELIRIAGSRGGARVEIAIPRLSDSRMIAWMRDQGAKIAANEA